MNIFSFQCYILCFVSLNDALNEKKSVDFW